MNSLPESTTYSQPSLFVDPAIDEQIATHYQPMFECQLTAETIRDVRSLRGKSPADFITICDMDRSLHNITDQICLAMCETIDHWKIDILLKYIPASTHDIVISAARDYAEARAAIHSNLTSENYDRQVSIRHADRANDAKSRAFRAILGGK